MRPLVASLCTGYGGLDLAVEFVFRAELTWTADVDRYASAIIAQRFPGIPNVGDIQSADFTALPPAEILTAGYPCQPFSTASGGRRKGSDDERHLWPDVRRAIRDIRPRLVVLENVAGHRSLGLDRVLGDLAEDGFDAEWCSLSAADAGSCHGRNRVFVLAYRPGDATPDDRGVRRQGLAKRDMWTATGLETPFRADDPRRDRHDAIADPGGVGRDGWRRAARYPRGPQPATYRLDHSLAQWGDYGPGVERWANIVGPPPAPTEFREGATHPRLNIRFAEWMMGLTPGWVTDCGVPVDDGDQYSLFDDVVPPPRELARVHMLKLLGNGVVPQQAEAALWSMIRSAGVSLLTAVGADA